ncbi:MAG: glycosyltransferase [Erythrobacter sp.]|nr:glycosyltransferase [Erythrobacter sp.]
MPRFSIVIPCYNNAATIGEAISSALAQRHDDFEVVVGDNGSSDASPQIIQAFDHPRLAADCHSQTLPKTDNWNRAYSQASDCEYLVTLHGDDRLHPDALAAIATEADHSSPALIHGRFHTIDASGNRTGTVGIPFDYTASGYEFRFMQLHANVVGVAGVAMRTDLFHQLGQWPREWTYMQDVEMWWRLSEHGHVRHTSKILGEYRQFDIPTNPDFARELADWTRMHMRDAAEGSREYNAARDSLLVYRKLLESKCDFAERAKSLPLNRLYGSSEPPRGLGHPAWRQRLFRISLVLKTLLRPDRQNSPKEFLVR